MKKLWIIILVALLYVNPTKAQQRYFPPLTGDQWDTVDPATLGWCTNQIDSVLHFLEEKNTKAFIMLKGGKIAMEHYFGTFTKDSVWYWASAGKTLAGFLVGMAQDEGLLDINDRTSDYLGKGWTAAPPEKEDLITIRHQLTMTSGLDDDLPATPSNPDPKNCLADSCQQYLVDAGTRWAYHNAPYRLLQDVVANASGIPFQQYTTLRIKQRIGMAGGWFNYVFWSRARDMARYGLLISNKGIWDQDTLLKDTSYYHAMVSPSQTYNESYGYLWWLNGQDSYMLPQTQFVFPGALAPNGPSDMFAGLGKNDQKVYVVPSMDLVVIRLGNSAEQSMLAASSFDNALWGELMKVFCESPTTGLSNPKQKQQLSLYPNPAQDNITIDWPQNSAYIKLYNLQGQEMLQAINTNPLDISQLNQGTYLVHVLDNDQKVIARQLLVKQ